MTTRPASTPPITDLPMLLAHLRPERQPGVFVFVSLPVGAVLDEPGPLATFREREGLSVVLEEERAVAAGLTPLCRAAWITLTVHSDLHAVGLMASVARVLTEAGVSCNVVAAAHHDHLFVPVEQAERAMAALHALSASARS